MDRLDLAIMTDSPSCLLGELGLPEEEILLFRPTEVPWAEVIPLRRLDQDIVNRGIAYLMRVRKNLAGDIKEGRLLCLERRGKVHKLVSLQLSSTGKFEFGVCCNQSRDPRDIPVTQLRICARNGYKLMSFQKSPPLYSLDP